MSGDAAIGADGMPDITGVGFDHLQFYVDAIKPADEYKAIEQKLNAFAKEAKSSGNATLGTSQGVDLTKAKAQWKAVTGEDARPEAFEPSGQDIVTQLMMGIGLRIVAENRGPETDNVLLCSSDKKGIKFLVTAKNLPATAAAEEPVLKKVKAAPALDHFAANKVTEYMKNMSGRQGIAVLCFSVESGNTLDKIHERYASKHPALICANSKNAPMQYSENGCRIFECYAYYMHKIGGEVDKATRLRFIERLNPSSVSKDPSQLLPGLVSVDHEYDSLSYNRAVYFDHWVSNVVDRQTFLDTLHDTLGFTPKVDFNAGVIAAGEARIESTVTGNDSNTVTVEKEVALKDQSQVYLPINNALSDVGHVHGFLKEMGNGVQHVANRVEDIVAFIQSANDFQRSTGMGFTFLNIPRSYYGILTAEDLGKVCNGNTEIVAHVMASLRKASLINPAGVVKLEIQDDEIHAAIFDNVDSSSELATQLQASKDGIYQVVRRSQYANMYKLLRGHLSEDTYIAIVRNKILVDIQGEDILFQIFTCNVLQRNQGEESPFIEFIQRVCSECKDKEGKCLPIKPGCGGFGIRNFLTLFLSIELSKSMNQIVEAAEKGDAAMEHVARRQVQLFTQQLDESNPILTKISDAMTEEGDLRQRAKNAASPEEREALLSRAESCKRQKEQGNIALQECSEKYKLLMQELRQGQ